MAKRSKKNVPHSATQRVDQKQVRTPLQQTDSKPSWRFSTVDKDGPFPWPAGANTELEIVKKLHSFDSMEWSQIEGRQHHSISVDGLSKAAQKRLQQIKQDDIDEVFSFHLRGKPRIFCIRDRHIAKLLWYDPEHQVCPSEKKHT